MHSYMNLVVLALAVSSVSTALSAPIQNRVDSDLFRRFGFTKTPSTPSEDAYSEDTAPAKDRISDYHRLAYISLAAASMLAAGVGLTDYLVHNKNKTRRTFEAFEGSVNAELVGRALGDHDLDKRLIWSTAADNDILASRDVPDMIATSSALSKRDLALGDTLDLLSSMIHELD